MLSACFEICNSFIVREQWSRYILKNYGRSHTSMIFKAASLKIE